MGTEDKNRVFRVFLRKTLLDKRSDLCYCHAIVSEILPDSTISGASFKQSLVYIWRSSRGVVLYVGMSKVGLKRVYGSHDILKDVRPEDSIEIYYTPEPLKLEQYFIKLYKPLYNSTYRKPLRNMKSIVEEIVESVKEEV